MGKVTEAAGWAGFGGLAFMAGQALEGKAFLRAAEALNARVEADFEAIQMTGRLMPVPMPQALVIAGPRSKPKLFWLCLIGGCATAWVLAFIVSLPVLLANPPRTGPAVPQAIFGAVVTGFGAAVLGGWVLAAMAWMIVASRENARRSAAVAGEVAKRYWAERDRAGQALARGANPVAVREHLWTYRIPTDPDDIAFDLGLS